MVSSDSPRVLRLHITNFLSYRSAVLEMGDFVALVGPNASGKSNAVAALKLLREIPLHGLPTAIARRGGYDQLRHRSHGHPYDPALRVDFMLPNANEESFYELRLGSLPGKKYSVKLESAVINDSDGDRLAFTNSKGRLAATDPEGMRLSPPDEFRVPPGQSAVSFAPSYGAYVVSRVLSAFQTIEINPARVADLQEPSSTREFEPDGSNTASIFESLQSAERQNLIDELSSIVPGISRIEVRRLADKETLAFFQETVQGKSREFLAKQMSDGTLRAFSILLATHQPIKPSLLVIEEPEIAIHLGALRTLVDLLRQEADRCQILITTHSADIVDTLSVDQLRVVWVEDGSSHISTVADHTRKPILEGLITPGELLRSDSLDPAIA